MISYTPWYIILGEFGIAVAFALLVRTLWRDSWRLAVVAGVVGGASIFVCYAAAFLITDRLIISRMKISKVFVLTAAILISATVMQASVPIIVATPGRMRAAMKLVTDAQDLLQKGDVAGAKRNVDTVIQRDPTFWPALYVRAQIYSQQGKYDLALKDCNEALRQDRTVVEAALLRANINARLGKYAETLKEYDYLVSLHPRNVTLARVLSDRAWFRATCPNASFRNGQQAVKDAKAACSIMIWKDEHMIDTLAVAYAETGDFNSAIQYASQALTVKGISADSTKLFQQHLALFQQNKPIRL